MKGFNFEEFYDATFNDVSSYQLVAMEYGHMDMLDSSCGPICNVCRAADENLAPRADFIGMVAASSVAIMKENLQNISGSEQSMMDTLDNNDRFILSRK